MARGSKDKSTEKIDKSPKACAVCGRTIEWRKKWEKSWSEVKFCSDKCRSAKSSKHNHENEILALLAQRARDKTICPSEVLSEADKQNPERMEEVRRAARRLVEKGLIEITQKGQVVDPSNFRGPIRLRLKGK